MSKDDDEPKQKHKKLLKIHICNSLDGYINHHGWNGFCNSIRKGGIKMAKITVIKTLVVFILTYRIQ